MLEDGVIAFRLTVGATDLANVENVETNYGAHTASYPMGTTSSYPERKAISLWNWLLAPFNFEYRGKWEHTLSSLYAFVPYTETNLRLVQTNKAKCWYISLRYKSKIILHLDLAYTSWVVNSYAENVSRSLWTIINISLAGYMACDHAKYFNYMRSIVIELTEPCVQIIYLSLE